MRKFFLIVLLSIITYGCNQKSEDLINDFSFHQMKSESVEIIIKLHDTLDTQKRSRNIESFTAKKEFKVSTNAQFDSFDKLFLNAEVTGYCCCPKAIYSLHLMNEKEEFGLFYVDTITIKDKIRFYDESFQFSYIIDKQKWNGFLKETEISKP